MPTGAYLRNLSFQLSHLSISFSFQWSHIDRFHFRVIFSMLSCGYLCLCSRNHGICKDFFLYVETHQFGLFATSTAQIQDAPVLRGAIDEVSSIERITYLLVRAIHMATFSSSHTASTGSLRKKVAELEKIRDLGKKRNPKKDDFIVSVPDSLAFLDTASMPTVPTAVGVALFTKVLMMITTQEMIEQKKQHAPPEQGTVRMLSREEWDEIQEIRPRTSFESKLARPNARLRTGEPLSMVEVVTVF
ncbi:hypothetical protein ACLOJK_007312 [Asimina triloba]